MIHPRFYRIFKVLAFLLSVSVALPACAMSRQDVAIHRKDGTTVTFSTEIAATMAERVQGLQGRPHMAQDEAMLFDNGGDEITRMWMKDTLIPLDMLFVDRCGTITYIHAQAKPNSRAIISNHKPSRGVMELAGGVALKQNIRVGDRIEHEIFQCATDK